MRIAAFLLAMLCAAQAGIAQEPIEWSIERRLVKDDFRGRVPPGAQNAALSWININAHWECEGGMFTSSVKAAFDPSRSWWRTTPGRVSGVVQLLEHEQLHFDLAEVVARKIRGRLNQFKSACDEVGATDPIQEILAQADRELQEEQHRYDRETSHGVNIRAQQQWKQRIGAMLN